MNRVFLLFGALGPMLLLARPVVPAVLPPIVHADAETFTNVPFAASLDAAVDGVPAFAVQVLPDAVVIRFR